MHHLYQASPLEWSSALASDAAGWANGCKWGHSDVEGQGESECICIFIQVCSLANSQFSILWWSILQSSIPQWLISLLELQSIFCSPA